VSTFDVVTRARRRRVKAWACSTPCNTDFLAKALGPKWSHKFFVNAELTPPDDYHGTEMKRSRAPRTGSQGC
jgi:hypothetical protein